MVIDVGHPIALEKGVGSSWDRDKEFIAKAKDGVEAGSLEKLQEVLDQMRNLSQGFGSYCGDLTELDELLDELYSELQDLLLSCR